MKYPPFSPISMDGSHHENGHEFSQQDDDLDSIEDTPIYISFSIAANFSDIGNSVASGSSIGDGSKYSRSEKESSQSDENRSSYFFDSLNSASNGDSRNLDSFSSNDCSSKENNEMDADSYREVYVDYKFSLSPRNSCMPCSPDNTIVAKNTRRKNDSRFNELSGDSDSITNMKRSNVNATPQTNLMTHDEEGNLTKLFNNNSSFKAVPNDTMGPFHQFGSLFWQKSESSDKNIQLTMETNTPNRGNDSKERISTSASSNKTKRESLVMPGCIFGSCAYPIDSMDEQIPSTSWGGGSWGKKILCPCRSNNARGYSQQVEGNNEQDDNDTEQGIEICVSDLDPSQHYKQIDENGLVLFLQSLTEKKASREQILNSLLRSKIYTKESVESSPPQYCDVMLSPSSVDEGQYSITIVPKKESDTSKTVLPNATHKYVISSVLIKSPKHKDNPVASYSLSSSSSTSFASSKIQQPQLLKKGTITSTNRQLATQRRSIISLRPQQRQHHYSTTYIGHPASSSSTTEGRGFKLRQGITPLGRKSSTLHFKRKKKRVLKSKSKCTVGSSSRDTVLNEGGI